jgi:glutamine cyclotransferase
MKYYNFLSIILLATILIQCDGSKKSFSLQTSISKSQFRPDESLKLKVDNPENARIDSVIYYINEQKIASVKQNTAYEYSLTSEKLGLKKIRTLVYYETKYHERETLFELVSPIEPKLLDFEIINRYPHDIQAYTQGLEFYRDTLFESTGNGEGLGTGKKGKSSIRKTNAKTGKIYQIKELDDQYFGEGLTILNNHAIQLTWTSQIAFVYNVDQLNQIKTINYSQKIQGWGFCNDGEKLYQSDGTEKIYVLNPENFNILETISVYSGAGKVKSLNELEWVNGKIYANVYQKDAIAIINAQSGAVEAIVNLSILKNQVTQHPDLDVLNGIAYEPKSGNFYVTGKNWDTIFEIKIKN